MSVPGTRGDYVMRVVVSAIVNRAYEGLTSTAQEIYDYATERLWGVTLEEVEEELGRGRIMFRYLASTDAACRVASPEPEGDPTYCINHNMQYGPVDAFNASNHPAVLFMRFALAMRGRAFPTTRLYLADPSAKKRRGPCPTSIQ